MTDKAELRIACIGWGSLIGTPGCLMTLGSWINDGPLLPVEFARESADGHITLVICPTAARVPTRWILLNQPDVQSAVRNLGYREYPKAAPKWISESIGFWDRESDTQYGMEADAIAAWGLAQGLDGVVWTNLPCGFKAGRGVLPSIDDVLAHLRRLDETALRKAENYVRNAPAEVDTIYRRQLVEHFGWG
ncbi:hypothetical protein ACJ7C5_16900 [Nocardiopsis yanglingensis]